MQTKFKDGSVLICGGCSKDAELEYVGDENKRVCKVGVAVGKRDDATIWVNVVAWRGLATILSTAKKGDPILVIGKLKSREYNGKIYTDLVADFINVASSPSGGDVPFAAFDGPADEDDGELPF